jgi:hypothetical protein
MAKKNWTPYLIAGGIATTIIALPFIINYFKPTGTVNPNYPTEEGYAGPAETPFPTRSAGSPTRRMMYSADTSGFGAFSW